MVTVTLYTRKGCHLCEQAKEDLDSLQESHPHRLVEIDIESDPALLKKYLVEIPVIEVGPYILKSPFDRQKLKMTLGAAGDRRLLQNLQATRENYWMVDDDFQLAVVAGRYFAAADVPQIDAAPACQQERKRHGPGQVAERDGKKLFHQVVSRVRCSATYTWPCRDGRLSKDDVALVLEEKRQVIRKSGLLEYTPADERLADVGEEGLGDLRGVKHLFSETLKGQVDAFVSIDGTGHGITNVGVGSHRYRVTFRGPGGHSFGAFGLVNPVHALGRAVARIAAFEVPAQPKVTFNVGRIGGGTNSKTSFEAVRSQTNAFEAVAGYTFSQPVVIWDATPERVRAWHVTSNFFSTLGVAPLIGRIRAGMTLLEIARAWSPDLPLHRGLSFASWLMARHLVVPATERQRDLG